MDKTKATHKDIEREHIAVIKEFYNSSAWREYALPMIMNVASKDLPKPGTERWEERYRYHYALSEALSLVINTISNLSNKDEFIKRSEQFLAGVDEA